jgi:branched-chain amino acid transport system substrate-binding protein
MSFCLRILLTSALCFSHLSYADVKIAFIDGLSGPMANAGEASLNQFRAAADVFVHQKGGVLGGQSLQFIPFDNKGSPQETLVALKAATDQGIRIVVQGNGSGAAAALIDGINKWNSRNPDKTVLYLNYGSVDPTLTNEKCSFWHFRFDASSAMRLEAMTSFIASDKKIKRVFIIGQNYAHGQQVSAISKQMLNIKRPDIEIVGDDLHPIGTVKDFSSYITKIRSSKADAIITGNWGNDLALLIKAAKESNLQTKFFTFYAGSIGSPAAIGSTGNRMVVETSDWHRNLYSNNPKNTYEIFANDYNKNFPQYEMYSARMATVVQMLAAAINKSNSLDPKMIAYALEGQKFNAHNGEVEMRKDDHQLLQALHISIFSPVDHKNVRIGLEGTGFGFKTLQTLAKSQTTLPHQCQMSRPE